VARPQHTVTTDSQVPRHVASVHSGAGPADARGVVARARRGRGRVGPAPGFGRGFIRSARGHGRCQALKGTPHRPHPRASILEGPAPAPIAVSTAAVSWTSAYWANGRMHQTSATHHDRRRSQVIRALAQPALDGFTPRAVGGGAPKPDDQLAGPGSLRAWHAGRKVAHGPRAAVAPGPWCKSCLIQPVALDMVTTRLAGSYARAEIRSCRQNHAGCGWPHRLSTIDSRSRLVPRATAHGPLPRQSTVATPFGHPGALIAVSDRDLHGAMPNMSCQTPLDSAEMLCSPPKTEGQARGRRSLQPATSEGCLCPCWSVLRVPLPSQRYPRVWNRLEPLGRIRAQTERLSSLRLPQL
jgi:hypothetical protein